MPEFSVIIPHYDSLDTLRRCINSIPESPLFEVIVVDDHSNLAEGEFDKLTQETTRSFKLIRLDENGGAGVARNAGIANATGKWLLFADADDYYLNSFQEVINDSIEKHKDSDIIIFNIDDEDNDSVQGKNYRRYIDAYDPTDEKTKIDVLYRCWSPWAKLFNAEFVRNNKLSFEPRKKGNDCAFVLNAMAKSVHTAIIKKPIYHLTYSPTSLSHTNNNNWDYMKDVYELWLWRYRFYRENNIQIWKEYNIYYLLKAAKREFGLKGAIKVLFLGFKYSYNYKDLLIRVFSLMFRIKAT